MPFVKTIVLKGITMITTFTSFARNAAKQFAWPMYTFLK
jgi:hypothetical protein